MIRNTDKGLFVDIKIVPNSSSNTIIVEDEYIKIKVTAQPVENKANKALIEYLSKEFKVPKTKIEIAKGITSKDKTLLFMVDEQEKIDFIISQLTKN